MPDLDLVGAQVIAQIEGQNWTDQPLTDSEKNLIWMAVRATAARLGVSTAPAQEGPGLGPLLI